MGRPNSARALALIRRQNAARGRELLQAAFDRRSERAESRAASLGALANGLSAEDEPLLMRAIQDARKEPREKGLSLIRRIPGSGFAQRWSERARQLVTVTENSLDVHQPDAPDPAWILDGLDPRPPTGIGATAWLLQQVVALTPPSIWPLAALQSIQHSEWSQPLLSGLAQAAVAYADADWCEALIIMTATTSPDSVRGVHMSAVLGALGPERAEAVTGRLLSARASGAAALAASLKQRWSEGFSRAVVAWLPDLLERHDAASALAHEAPLRLDPRVLPDAQLLLHNHTEPAWLRPALQRLVRTLEFRSAMRKELQAS